MLDFLVGFKTGGKADIPQCQEAADLTSANKVSTCSLPVPQCRAFNVIYKI